MSVFDHVGKESGVERFFEQKAERERIAKGGHGDDSDPSPQIDDYINEEFSFLRRGIDYNTKGLELGRKCKAFNGLYHEQMPQLIAEGLIPLSVADIMTKRLFISDTEVNKRHWENFEFYTCDGIAITPEKKFKIVFDSEDLISCNVTSSIVQNGIVISKERYGALNSEEYNLQELTNLLNKPLEINKDLENNPILISLVRDKSLLREYFKYVENSSREDLKVKAYFEGNPWISKDYFKIIPIKMSSYRAVRHKDGMLKIDYSFNSIPLISRDFPVRKHVPCCEGINFYNTDLNNVTIIGQRPEKRVNTLEKETMNAVREGKPFVYNGISYFPYSPERK